MKEKDFPCYYVDSNAASRSAQNTYKLFIWTGLALMLLATIAESISFSNDLKKFSAMAIFASGLISICLTLLKPDRNWYKGRAIAESIRTLSWRYMMHVDPFDAADDSQNLTHFTERLDEINRQANQEGFIPKPNKKHSDVITSQMDAIRGKNFSERKELYRTGRIEDQIQWYSRKSRRNRRQGLVCSWMIISCQILAGIYLLKFDSPDSKLNLNAIMIFTATSITGIMELYKFKDLYQAYALTEKELNIIKSRFGLIHDDRSFNQFVLEAEQAISREHTMWLARRG